MKMQLIAATVLFISLVVSAQPQSTAPALSPEAQANFDKGLAAAEQKEWQLAVQYFEEARWHVPDRSPFLPLFFNLGLAYAKAGDELPAIAWLEAYLASSPQAKNDDEVRKEITRLDVATEAKVRKLIRSSVESLDKIGNASDRRWVAAMIALEQAEIGDFDGARKTMLMADFVNEKSLQKSFALYKGMKGEFTGAEMEGEDVDWRNITWFWEEIDSNLASAAAKHIKDEKEREELVKRISARERKPGNNLEVWQRIGDEYSRSWGLHHLPGGEWRREDIEEAIRDISKREPAKIPDGLAHLAGKLSKDLLRIEALVNKFHN